MKGIKKFQSIEITDKQLERIYSAYLRWKLDNGTDSILEVPVFLDEDGCQAFIIKRERW